jgi:putative flippase GtrA
LFYLFFYHVFVGLCLSVDSLTLVATALAFALSTLYHYFLGNILVFDSGSKYNKGKELSLVFLVSIMGLVFNLIFMYLFVGLFNWQPMLAKVITSCIVVVWNYLSRKKWIFRS